MGMFARPKTLVCLLILYGLLFVKQYHKGWEEPLWTPPLAEGTASRWSYQLLFRDLMVTLGNCAELLFLFVIIPQLYLYPLLSPLPASEVGKYKKLEKTPVDSPESFRSYSIITVLASLHQFPLRTSDFQQGLLAVARTFFIWPATLLMQIGCTILLGAAFFNTSDDDTLSSEAKGIPEAGRASSQGDLVVEDVMEKGHTLADNPDMNVEAALLKDGDEDVQLENWLKQAFKFSAIWKTDIDLQKHTALIFVCLFCTFLTYLLFPTESPAKPEWVGLDHGYSWMSWWHRILVELAVVLAALNCVKLGGVKVVTVYQGLKG